MSLQQEKERQEQYPWERSLFYEGYSEILGYYQAISCIENAQKGSLLDLACGDGSITQHFVKVFNKIVGIDASTDHLARAKQKNPSVIFHDSLVESLNQKINLIQLLCLIYWSML